MSLNRFVILYGNVIRHSFQNVLNSHCHPWYRYDWTDARVYINPTHGLLSSVLGCVPPERQKSKYTIDLMDNTGTCYIVKIYILISASIHNIGYSIHWFKSWKVSLSDLITSIIISNVSYKNNYIQLCIMCGYLLWYYMLFFWFTNIDF